jgi:hypothetical protein
VWACLRGPRAGASEVALREGGRVVARRVLVLR